MATIGKGRHYCTTCRSWYRRLGGIHDSTVKHRTNLRRARGRQMTKKERRSADRAGRGKRVHDDNVMVKVHDYYRDPPTPPWPASIKDKVWYVVDHWRRPPGTVSGGVRVAHHRRRRRAR